MYKNPWEPRKFERHLFHEVYIDETSQNDHSFLVLGGIVLPREVSGLFESSILEARLPRLRSLTSKGELREMGWSEISNGDYESYKKVLDAFFSFPFQHMQGIKGTCRFCCSVVGLKAKGRNYSRGKRGQIGFNREIYFHCLKAAHYEKFELFHVYPDDRSTTESTEQLRLILNRGIRKRGDKRDWPFRRVQFKLSHTSQAMQVSDILIGAVAYRLNRSYDAPNANADKKQLCDYVLKRTGFDKNIRERSFRQKTWGMCQLWARRPGTKR